MAERLSKRDKKIEDKKAKLTKKFRDKVVKKGVSKQDFKKEGLKYARKLSRLEIRKK